MSDEHPYEWNRMVIIEELLYQCIRELEYVQCCDGPDCNLSATSKGKHLINEGMKLLRVKDLRNETLY